MCTVGGCTTSQVLPTPVDIQGTGKVSTPLKVLVRTCQPCARRRDGSAARRRAIAHHRAAAGAAAAVHGVPGPGPAGRAVRLRGRLPAQPERLAAGPARPCAPVRLLGGRQLAGPGPGSGPQALHPPDPGQADVLPGSACLLGWGQLAGAHSVSAVRMHGAGHPLPPSTCLWPAWLTRGCCCGAEHRRRLHQHPGVRPVYVRGPACVPPYLASWRRSPLECPWSLQLFPSATGEGLTLPCIEPSFPVLPACQLRNTAVQVLSPRDVLGVPGGL